VLTNTTNFEGRQSTLGDNPIDVPHSIYWGDVCPHPSPESPLISGTTVVYATCVGSPLLCKGDTRQWNRFISNWAKTPLSSRASWHCFALSTLPTFILVSIPASVSLRSFPGARPTTLLTTSTAGRSLLLKPRWRNDAIRQLETEAGRYRRSCHRRSTERDRRTASSGRRRRRFIIVDDRSTCDLRTNNVEMERSKETGPRPLPSGWKDEGESQ